MGAKFVSVDARINTQTKVNIVVPTQANAAQSAQRSEMPTAFRQTNT